MAQHSLRGTRYYVSSQSKTQGSVASRTCNLCNKVFTRSYTVRRHKAKVHRTKASSDGPNKCDICRKVFTGTNKLREHKKSCRTLKCKDCECVFNRLEDFEEHICGRHNSSILQCWLCLTLGQHRVVTRPGGARTTCRSCHTVTTSYSM